MHSGQFGEWYEGVRPFEYMLDRFGVWLCVMWLGINVPMVMVVVMHACWSSFYLYLYYSIDELIDGVISIIMLHQAQFLYWVFYDRIDRHWRSMFASRNMSLEETNTAIDLLLYLLPVHVVGHVLLHGESAVDVLPDVTMLQADVVGFTHTCHHISTTEACMLLNSFFSAFDDLVVPLGCYKLYTVGGMMSSSCRNMSSSCPDGYVVVAGIPGTTPYHAAAICSLSLAMHAAVSRVNAVNAKRGLPSLRLRTGIATGPMCGGMCGSLKPLYLAWDHTKNRSGCVTECSRLERHCPVDCVLVSTKTVDQVCDWSRCVLQSKEIQTFEQSDLFEFDPSNVSGAMMLRTDTGVAPVMLRRIAERAIDGTPSISNVELVNFCKWMSSMYSDAVVSSDVVSDSLLMELRHRQMGLSSSVLSAVNTADNFDLQ